MLTHQLPLLVAELLEAAADDLEPDPPDGSADSVEREADGDLRLIEATEACPE